MPSTSAAPRLGPGKRIQPTAFEALVASSQILQRSIVREKLKAQQPDIYVDVDVDAFNVLGFHKFRDILAAAEPAKAHLRRQLQRVLASQTVETLPAVVPGEPPRQAGPQAAPARPQAADAGAAGHERLARPRIALALGGGSARGLAHILMLEAFDELGVKPSIIAGTSMGSICGAAYAAGLSAAEIRAEFEGAAAQPRDVFRSASPASCAASLPRSGACASPSIIDNTTLFEMLLPEALHRDFASLKIPFVAIATDFYGIQQVVLDHGPLIPALAASCSLPGLSRPVVLEGRLLIDGGYINPVPYDVVMHRADITVAVDVTGDPQRRPDARAPGTFDC